jgi:hypothetical protein
MSRKASWFALVGLVLPCVWIALYFGVPTFNAWVYSAPIWVGTLRLVLWPSAILLVADPMENTPTLWVVSVALNGALYFVVGEGVARARRASITGSARTL